MKISLLKVTVKELVKDYDDNKEGGVRGYGGKLDIRPPYQREFVYEEKQRDAVIQTVRKGFPLNVMYWADRGDGTFEIIDGQQRTISICQYVEGDFSIDGLGFHNLQDDQREEIYGYELMVYVCTGTDSEKLDWFRVINIAGEELTDQEMHNAVYHGPWVSDAKKWFSRHNCPAQGIAGKFLNGASIRQEYLETAIKWISGGDVKGYMSEHQHDKSAVALWSHFQSVINWIEATFTKYRKPMKGVDWGSLYAEFGDSDLDPEFLEKETERLMMNEEITNHRGIYPYLLTGDESKLNVRIFPLPVKRRVYERQKGICLVCGKRCLIEEMDADHVNPWSKGGKTEEGNCQVICRKCNRRKGAR